MANLARFPSKDDTVRAPHPFRAAGSKENGS
jgi:hypothetical protein